MQRFLILFFFFFSLCLSQDLPNSYRILGGGNNASFLVRGGFDVESGLYSELSIDTIFLYFSQSDYWEQMLDNYCDKINIPATLVYKGESFSEVGVRFKGQTSFFNTNGDSGGGPGGGGPGGGGPGGGGPGGNVDTDKKSFNIELDWINNQDIDGYGTLNLNNCYQDPSFLREFIFEKLSRNYIPSAKVNFIQLMINDQNWGIYPNVQQLDKKHASEWFFDSECTRWRAEDPNNEAPGCGEPGSGGGPGGGPGSSGPDFGAGTSSLNYLGSDTSLYMNHYTLKKAYKANPWDDLVNTCQVIDQADIVQEIDVYDMLNEYLDLDATLWYLANEIIFSDDDSYINKGGMDYYVYFDIYNERILPIEYDGNTVFKNPNWSPFYNADDPNFVLLHKLLAIPELRERYLAHFRTIIANSLNPTYINNLIDQYADFIDNYVDNDPQKIYTYDDFLNEIDVIKNYFSNRISYLWSNSELFEVFNSGIDILNVEYYVGNTAFAQPNNLEEVLVAVEVESTNPVEVNLYYGTDLTGRFNKTPMSYNFATNLYTYNIPPQNAGEFVRFYIETVNENGTRVYDPPGAEHDVYIYQVKMEDLFYADDSDIVINELMASNDQVVADEYGEFDDWIEIYNKGNQMINLSGMHLSDDIANLGKYTFPNINLAPGDYFIVWADDDEEEQGDFNHATFKLSADGETLILSDADFTILNQVTFGEQITDMGYARVPNGVGSFIIQSPTYAFNNNLLSSHLEQINSNKYVIKQIDLLGRDNTQSIGFVVNLYNDGSVEKKFIISNSNSID